MMQRNVFIKAQPVRHLPRMSDKARRLAQDVVRNLMAAAIEFRGEDDADVAPHRHATAREVLTVQPGAEVGAARAALLATLRRALGDLGRSQVGAADPNCER